MTDRPTTDAAHHHAEAWVPIRSLAHRHLPEISAHLLALAPGDRYLRFGYAAIDSHIERYVDSLNFERDDIFGIIDRRLRLIAMGHLACAAPAELLPQRLPDSSGSAMAEFGVSVLPHARRRGYGRRLFENAMLHARNRSLDTLYIHALSENTAMLHIARQAGATIERSGGESDAYLRLPEGTLGSHAEALWSEGMAAIDHLLKQQSHSIGVSAVVGDGNATGGTEADRR